MRVLNLRELCQSPPGTVFSAWRPCVSDGLMVFCEALNETDFFYVNLLPGPKCPTQFEEFNPDSCVIQPDLTNRWGMYDETETFAVYDKEEVARLASILTNALQAKVEAG